MGDLAPLTRDNVISMVDECHRSQKGDGTESFAMTMRVKLANGFRYGFTGTPIDRTMQNTHRDFGPLKDGVQERYLSYYGIRRAIRTARRWRCTTSATGCRSRWTRRR